MYDSEFPALARATNNMEQGLMKHVAQNLSLYSVEVRIDYERWVQYRREYSSWLQQQNQTRLGSAEDEQCKTSKGKTKDEFYKA